MEEFLERRVRWIELDPALQPPDAPALQRALGLLVEPEGRIATTLSELRNLPDGPALVDVMTAIVLSRFRGRSIGELCAMTGLSLEDFRQSVVYREIFGTGKSEGEVSLVLRQLRRRCGNLSAPQEATIRTLPLERLQPLADALLDFSGAEDLRAWLQKTG
jgi:predicted transposase YdaD